MKKVLLVACFGFSSVNGYCNGIVSGFIETDLPKHKGDVVVYLKNVGGPVVPRTVAVDQHHMKFNPRVVVVPVGSTIEFSNHDKIYHNVFSISEPKKFSIDTYASGSSKKITFDKPGVVTLLCHIHPEMSGWVIVTENQYAAVTEHDGEFKIHDVPAGTYEVGVWSETQKTQEKITVTVKDGQTTETTIKLGN
jgi:plastocyanin